ncbi:hypothetical protein [uncultured Mesonia sp.]|uniref:hypothetical protein n=1 Tax=uncultured Mesonia sp. TaxID=399731 RepID=UPI00374E4009
MNNFVLSPIEPDKLISSIIEKVSANIIRALQTQNTGDKSSNPLNDYIPKTEIRGVLASNSTLWKLENEGKLTVYGVGGKRYYKRADIENLFQPLNVKR